MDHITILGLIKSTAQTIQSTQEIFAHGNGNLIAGIGEIMSDVIVTVSQAGKGVVHELGQSLSSVFTSIADGSSKLILSTGTSSSKIITSTGGAIKNTGKGIKQIIKGIFGPMSNLILWVFFLILAFYTVGKDLNWWRLRNCNNTEALDISSQASPDSADEGEGHQPPNSKMSPFNNPYQTTVKENSTQKDRNEPIYLERTTEKRKKPPALIPLQGKPPRKIMDKNSQIKSTVLFTLALFLPLIFAELQPYTRTSFQIEHVAKPSPNNFLGIHNATLVDNLGKSDPRTLFWHENIGPKLFRIKTVFYHKYLCSKISKPYFNFRPLKGLGRKCWFRLMNYTYNNNLVAILNTYTGRYLDFEARPRFTAPQNPEKFRIHNLTTFCHNLLQPSPFWEQIIKLTNRRQNRGRKVSRFHHSNKSINLSHKQNTMNRLGDPTAPRNKQNIE